MTEDGPIASVEDPLAETALQALRDAQQDRGLPALTRSELDAALGKEAALGEDAADVDVDALVAEGRLGCFEAGEDRVYWVADGDHAGGYVEVTPETAAGEAVGADDASDHDGDDREGGAQASAGTVWHRLAGLGDTLLRASALLFAVGLGIIFADGPLLASVDLSEGTVEAGEYLFLVGIVTVVLAVVLVVAGLAGRVARGRNWPLAGSREGQQDAD